MSLIRVTPSELRDSVQQLRDAVDELTRLSQEIQEAAASAPSYDGQFAPAVGAYADESVQQILPRVAQLAALSEWLSARADAFEEADRETQESLEGLSVQLRGLMDQHGPLLAPNLATTPVPVAETAQADGQVPGGGLQTVGGHIGDFFIGMWDEGKDMVTGLVNLITDPVGTAKGLWYGITHPAELWEAFKQPYVEAWESGHPGQAIGRGVMFIGTIVLGTKGADKISNAVKAARAARVTTEAAEAGARAGSALTAARQIGTVARGSSAETALARYIATESTHTFGTFDRVVIGGFRPNPTRGFLGYFDEAAAHGGTAFSTGDDVWRIADAAGSNRGWTINREFMQSQLERGVPRFELAGETVSEVLGGRRALSGTADEVRYLQRYAYEYGYRQVGDTWIKVGDWRASTTGRAFGGGVGPALDVLEEINP